MRPDGPECSTCSYCPDNTKFIPPDGNGASRILLVGDSPWKDEQREGRVFAGAAGRMLDRILQMMPGWGLQRGDLTIWNTIQCSPPHLGWMDMPKRFPAAAAAIEHCRGHLDTLVSERRPAVIVPLGNVALRRVCGLSGIEAVAGYVLPTPYGIPAVPTYHPSFLLKGKQNLIPVVLWALSRASGIARGEHKETEYEMLLDPSPAELEAYFAQDYDEIFIDIETPESGKLDEEELEEAGVSFTIIRAGASVRKSTSVSFPWVQPFIGIYLRAISKARTIIEWADNRFDTRRLAVAGADFRGKRIISGMWAWHWLQSDLRKGLNLVAPFYYCGRPWKHLSQAEPAYYNGMDNAVGMDCWLGIRDALVQQKRFDAFLRYCVEPTPYFESMGKAGLLINTDYREQFMTTIRKERDVYNAKIQALVPDECRPRKFWKRPPKDMTGVVEIMGAGGSLPHPMSREADADTAVSERAVTHRSRDTRQEVALSPPVSDDVVPPNGAKGGVGSLPERPSGDWKDTQRSIIPRLTDMVELLPEGHDKCLLKPSDSTIDSTCVGEQQESVENGSLRTALVVDVAHGSGSKSTTPATEAPSLDGKLESAGSSSGTLAKRKGRRNSSSASSSVTIATSQKPTEPTSSAPSSTAQESPTKSTAADAANVSALKLLGPADFAIIKDCGYKYVKILEMNPGSWQQVQDLARTLNVKLPKKEDAESDEDTSTDEKALKKAAKDKKHGAIFKEILEWRKRQKLITAYMWSLDDTGRVHYQFGYHPSTWRKCVARGTMIEVVRDVSKRPFGIPIEEVKPGDLAYTFDANGKLTLRPVVWVKPTGVKKIIRLHWTTLGGHCLGFLDVTPDHLVRLVDGTYKEAQHLNITYGRRKRTAHVGDAVMALHRGTMPTGYSRLTGRGLPNGKYWMLDHTFVHEQVIGAVAEVVHHKDGNKLNNLPENLRTTTASEHLHIEGYKRRRGRRSSSYNHRIIAIEELPEPVEVWDMEVQGTHNFVANELCVHNSCRNVNIQTIPKRSDLAKKFRRMIVAAPGCVLVEGDSAAIEAVLVGYLAHSERYIRLAKAGVHGWLTSALHGIPIKLSLSDTDLARECRDAKKQWPDDYEKCKRVTHLTGYLGTPRRIFEEYPDDFESEAEARKLQQFLLNTEAGADIKRWQKATVEEAHGNKYLENYYGLRHRFYTLYQWNPRRQAYDLGDDAKRAVAFRPQSIASFIQTDVVLRMVEWGWGPSLRAIIHDSIVMEVPDDEARHAARALQKALVEPRQVLGGLEIGAEVSIGRNLAPYSNDNPDGMIEMSEWVPVGGERMTGNIGLPESPVV